MAIAFDAASNSGTKAAIAAGTFTHTVGAGLSNSILIFTSGMRDTGSLNFVLGTVTFAGTALTKVRADQYISSPAFQRSEIWYILSPPAGANSLVYQMAGTVGDVGVGVVSLSGVDQSNPIDAQNGGTATSTTGSITYNITTIANNAWAIDAMYTNSDFAISGTFESAVNYNLVPHSAGDQDVSGRNINITPAGVSTFLWTGAQSGEVNAHSLVSLKPFVAASAVQTRYRTLLGVGQ